MAENRGMTPAELADKLMSTEHADVVREPVAWMVPELMEAEVVRREVLSDRCGVRDLAAGLSQQSGEAGGSPSLDGGNCSDSPTPRSGPRAPCATGCLRSPAA